MDENIIRWVNGVIESETQYIKRELPPTCQGFQKMLIAQMRLKCGFRLILARARCK